MSRLLTLALFLALPLPAAVRAQGGAPDVPADTLTPASPDARPSAPFPTLLASPLEPGTRLAPVRVDREGRNRWVGLVNLGDAFPFRLAGAASESGDPDGAEGSAGGSRPQAPALWGEVAGGAFSRFDLEGNSNEFIEVHFRIGLRLRARWQGVNARLELYHVSSHLGDEFLQRTGRQPISTSREGVELLAAAWPLDNLRLYGGPGAVLRSTAGLDPGTLRAGAEWRPHSSRWGPFRPYASAELFARDELGWEPMVSGEAGMAFGGRYRLSLVVGAGPSRAEQFLREDERLWGLSFSADL